MKQKSAFKTFRMYFQKIYARKTDENIDSRYFSGEYVKTDITFRARNEEEATKKARKFCNEAQIAGVFRVELEGN